MDAVELLQQHLDVVKVLGHYGFNKIRPDGEMIRSCCEIHNGDNPSGFVISQETGLWYCHTGACGGGDIFTLVQKMEECNFTTSVRRVAEILGIDIASMTITERKSTHIKELREWVKAMKSRKKEEKKEYIIEAELKDVAKFRNFKEETLQKFGLKFVEKIELAKRDGSPYVLTNRLVFPIVQNGIQVGASLRKTRSKDVPKWSHQPAHIDTRDLLYNLDATESASKIVIVEGMPDVWAYDEIGIVAVCTFGAHITEEQYKMLMRTGKDLVLSFDGDEAGRVATERAIDLFRYKCTIEVVEMREGEDPDNIDREELVKRYEHKRRI